MSNKPNILFVMTDQQRWDALGTVSPWLDTPNLDRLANEGTRFTECVTTTPICIPARFTLATGLYPHNNGIWSNVNYAIPAGTPTWMKRVRAAGYRTSLFGKTHLHPHRGDLREREGLMHEIGIDDVDEIGGPRASATVMSHMTARWEELGYLDAYREDFRERFANKPHVVRPSVLPLEEYADVYVGQQAATYLREYDRSEPWCCWVSFGGPHEPWDTPEPFASRYDPAAMPAPVERPITNPARPTGWLDHYMARSTPDFEPGDVEAMRANYAGNVTLIDDQIGAIFDAIKARGEWDDTAIVFTSDHGEMNGDWNLIYKMNFLDGALRVPLIVKIPGCTPGVSHSMAENGDAGATMVEIAGGEHAHRQFAQSLADIVADETTEHRANSISEFRGEFMIVDESWKAAINRDGACYLLFDRKNDPRETTNLAGLPDYHDVESKYRLAILERVAQSQLKEPIEI